MSGMLDRLVAHMRWADAIVADALLRADAPEPNSVRLFAHVAAAEHLWYARIHGETPGFPVWPTLTVAEARDVAAREADHFAALVSTPDELSRMIQYRNSKGQEFENRVDDIVTHVAMHGSYHRGQIARHLRLAGMEPPYTDFIQFIRAG
ncbi:MAG TPA: DinB family protein [Gemmatimonadaceae bacterium]|nr:DinB family protein [Gemmatimonadaceae bacterium]